MTQLYAQPYDITANGFYFESLEQYTEKADRNRNSYGGIVEEYEIQFIDGSSMDARLFDVLGISQCNIGAFLDACDGWDEGQKRKAIIAVGECGYDFELGADDPDDFEVDIYEVESLKELAEQFVDEGLYGDIPENIRGYLDYDAIARDLGMDYCEIVIGGERMVYRCL